MVTQYLNEFLGDMYAELPMTMWTELLNCVIKATLSQ